MDTNKKTYLYIITILIILVTGLHYFTSFQEIRLHELYRRLYYIPIILAAFNFRIKGGIILPIVVSILYLPYILFYSDHSNVELVINFFEIIMFYTVGSITGILAEKSYLNMEKISRLQEHIRRADKLSAVGQLASGVAHEIRNPLAIIKTVSQTLLQDDDGIKDEENRQALEIIQEEVNRANKVIKELLDFAKFKNIERTKIDINEVIRNVVLLTNKYAQKKGTSISIQIAEQNLYIYGDSEKLKQAFVNIIFNAVDAVEEAGNIYIQVLRKKSIINISFEDNGVGISTEQKEKIFNPFYTTKDNGVGLGLAITYRIIDEHEGNIDIQSILEKGTKVIVSLPLVEMEDGK